MYSKPSQEALAALDTIVTSSSSREIVDAIRNAFYVKALDKLDAKRKDMGDDLFRGAKPAEEMGYVASKMPKAGKDAQADAANNVALKTGQHAAGGLEPATQYKGNGVGANGWMNPPEGKTTPRPWGGDRRPNRSGGPEFPFYDGTVPNGSGV